MAECSLCCVECWTQYIFGPQLSLGAESPSLSPFQARCDDMASASSSRARAGPPCEKSQLSVKGESCAGLGAELWMHRGRRPWGTLVGRGRVPGSMVHVVFTRPSCWRPLEAECCLWGALPPPLGCGSIALSRRCLCCSGHEMAPDAGSCVPALSAALWSRHSYLERSSSPQPTASFPWLLQIPCVPGLS